MIVKSIMTCEAEIWITKEKTKDKVRAVGTEYQRRCCEVTRLVKIRNGEVRMIMEETSELKRKNLCGMGT